MKKFIRVILLAGILAALLCVTALAADNQSGIYDLKPKEGVIGYALGAQTADGTNVDAAATVDGKQLYAGAERITLTGENVTGFNLVLVMKGDETVITVDNLVYVDQQTDTVAFNIYPSKLEGNVTYHIYLSNSNGTGKQEIATFRYYQAYKLGDVNGDTEVDIRDVVSILENIVGNVKFTQTQTLSADVNVDGDVDIRDVVTILEYIVGNIKQLGK